LAWVRGMDVLPVLTTEKVIENSRAELAERKARISGSTNKK
jgi:hypothetical protein